MSWRIQLVIKKHREIHTSSHMTKQWSSTVRGCHHKDMALSKRDRAEGGNFSVGNEDHTDVMAAKCHLGTSKAELRGGYTHMEHTVTAL